MVFAGKCRKTAGNPGILTRSEFTFKFPRGLSALSGDPEFFRLLLLPIVQRRSPWTFFMLIELIVIDTIFPVLLSRGLFA